MTTADQPLSNLEKYANMREASINLLTETLKGLTEDFPVLEAKPEAIIDLVSRWKTLAEAISSTAGKSLNAEFSLFERNAVKLERGARLHGQVELLDAKIQAETERWKPFFSDPTGRETLLALNLDPNGDATANALSILKAAESPSQSVSR